MTERQKEIMSLGKPVVCPVCRETSYLHPKGSVSQPYIWEMNCSLCHLTGSAVNAYIPEHEELYKILNTLLTRHIEGETSEDLKREIDALAEEYDNKLDNRLCECGGYLSISAKPKCIFCDVEISDSYFHYADDTPR